MLLGSSKRTNGTMWLRRSGLLLALPLVQAFECTESAFQSILPPDASIISATSLTTNSTFHVPASNIAYPTSPTQLQALCAIEVNVTSSPISAYTFGLFLPENWNQRFLAVGNGGFAGGINWLDMGAGVGYGFAVMSTDTGHNSTSRDGRWALNKERLTDWGYRAMHGSVVHAKGIVAAYYGSNATWNYYSGCSTGGRQGLKEVEAYPEDFDGVLAGAPAWWTSHLQTWTVKMGQYNSPNGSAHHIPSELFPVIGAEVLKQCDPQDGLVDSIISDPQGCHFYPEALLCGANVTNQTAAGCLTAPQLDTLDKIWGDYVETNQTFVFPHVELGAEAQWETLLGLGEPNSLGIEYVRYFLLNDGTWDFHNFDYSIVELADRLQPGGATASNFNISPFHARGGKLLHYHGLADALIATGSSIYFHRKVLETLTPKGIDLDSWYRFFLVPGMQHCLGTPTDVDAPWYFGGANQAAALSTSVSGVPGFRDAKHDALLALMAWTENGTAPDAIIATAWQNETLHDEVLRQRPLCPYPQHARYLGQGDPNLAQSWKCTSAYGLTEQ
ncbi:ferulic acid Esterase Feruloyl esterase [Lecanosticta acicola]|uniref:Carboxylic ester hydrolase n=1 Tax=Lecanosticta acicola TaxID=111012 RepID=A0AAI8YUK6_9PEZI|nr:ferulic acid Esterase Feruloyl esterase [Lecanosticta acicola]